jgi:hypothetical protein
VDTQALKKPPQTAEEIDKALELFGGKGPGAPGSTTTIRTPSGRQFDVTP